ncbi:MULTISPECIES: peptide ABC transporter substrate-binding protein [Chromohalobacter]|jgi:oligopeptide transport system substrate-binding protein|uniref:peptide ABC transporter substrate-binding protein n=1 Tax=Chromohalobacter TaxID=42054 RepID=UPI000D716C2E|nr:MULTISPECIES: peptide ABC transporter substrate-binding protein [Chromohalobacter]NQY45309.1 peptide ABC transporter substrate-binding protein [Chromohalobacter sp.]NWO56531.1 peptide ABC transporter substrate-binding protein [Chromohalobacter salexigens]PWW33602.1 oligopeptide transport system substrate-binding protein [Chromohalobacter salexigens]
MLRHSHTRLATTLLSSLSLASLALAAPAQADTLNIGVMGELASFDTSQVSGGVWESQILMDVYEGLLKENPEGEVMPGMATDWDISEDGRTYTFHLREGAKWSDGAPVTAEDFVFGWQHLLDPASASKYAYLLYPIKNAEAVNTGDRPLDALGVESLDDGKTLKVTLDAPTPYFLQLLTHYTAYPVPKHAVEKYGKQWVKMDNIVTNGAFTPVEWVSQSRISVEKNPDYYEADEVELDGVNYFNTEDRNAAISRFRAGELDIVRDYPSSRYQWLEDNLPEATHLSPMLGSYYYVLNTREGRPTADKRVREALNLVARRKVLSEQIMAGSFKDAYSLVPPGTSHYDVQRMDGVDGDYQERLARAKQLIEEAGYGPDNPLHLQLRYNTSDEHKKIAIALAAMWKPLGVDVEMTNAEATVHYQTIQQGDFDIARAGWIADYNDAENFLTLLRSGVGNNYGGYANPEYDALLAQAATVRDLDEREALLEKAENVALDDYALVPLLYYVTRNLVNPDISGWQDNAEDDHPSRWVTFTE